jgi:hypothetical protein
MNSLFKAINNFATSFKSTNELAPTETDTLIKLMKTDKELYKRVIAWQNKALSIVRTDVKQWKNVWQLMLSDDPKSFGLQLLYKNEILQDLILTSQMENRINKALKTAFSLKQKKSGEKDDEQSIKIQQSSAIRTIIREILLAQYLGYSMVEIHMVKNDSGEDVITLNTIPRENFVPSTGRFYPDYTEDKFIEYRNVAEFGINILEFNSGGVGLINKIVPHVLFKKFSLSCWSELCEIFGIPPRVLKTDTQNPAMLNRAKSMMMDTGAAAWYIIDESEKIEWANGVTTNGDVFKQLIACENNEISMGISGAIISQDTTNGSRSKDESAQDVLQDLVDSDLIGVEHAMNEIVIPALVRLGFVKGDFRFEFDATEDLTTLWERTKDSFSDFNVNPEFLKTKFGIDVLSAKNQDTKPNDPNKKLNLDFNFFE